VEKRVKEWVEERVKSKEQMVRKETDILGNDPPNAPQLLLNPSLLNTGVLPLDIIRKPETDHRQSFHIIFRILLVER
jgi:hypothetical protein